MPTPGIDSVKEIQNQQSKPMVKLSPDPFHVKELVAPAFIVSIIMIIGWVAGKFFLIPMVLG